MSYTVFRQDLPTRIRVDPSMLVSVGLRVPADAIVSNKDVGVPTKTPVNVRHRVVSPACIAEKTASVEIRFTL